MLATAARLTVILAVLPLLLSAQIWTAVPEASLRHLPTVPRTLIPTKALYYELNLAQLQAALQQAPVRGTASGPSILVLPFPTASGRLERFRVMEAPVMPPQLAARYPMIRTYCAQGVDDPTATLRFSLTQYGLHGFLLSGRDATEYIDPYSADLRFYLVYAKTALPQEDAGLACLVENESEAPLLAPPGPAGANTDDQQLRTFRLALSCTAEYGNFFAVTPGTEKADIQAAMAVALNRINGILERDLAVTLQLIPNNDTLLFYGDPAADPWLNAGSGNPFAQFLDDRIGQANYDIGHNFNDYTGGDGGCIGCVCQAQNVGGFHKGRGHTGMSNVGDAITDFFYVDLVAHEMGHQFGGLHTMNRCGRSAGTNGPQYVEPGSGSTIMSYAATCYPHVQNRADDEYHYASLQAMAANLQSGYSTCGLLTPLANHPPTADAGPDHVIPKGTAFLLEGQATDEDGLASLTFNWAENDTEESPSDLEPKPTYALGPLYRSIKAGPSPNRYLPRLRDVVANNLTPTWEVTPAVARTFNFSFLVRDNDVNGGQTASDLMMVTVDSSGPFLVTSQSEPAHWIAGTDALITWEVAGTAGGAVNTPLVDIYLSADSGYTWPYALALHVPNNGSAVVTLPQGIATNAGRVMVRGADNIFFALNRRLISIEAPEFYLQAADTVQSLCPPGAVAFDLNYLAFLAFQDTTVFSVSGQPAGSTVTFDPPLAVDSNTPVQLSISGLTPGMVGSYPLTLTGTAGSISYNTTLVLNVLTQAPSTVVPLAPSQNASGVALPVVLSWNALPGADMVYDVEVATDLNFADVVANGVGLPAATFTTPLLQPLTTYYWRVRARNPCGVGEYLEVFAFTTGTCVAQASANVPLVIPSVSFPVATVMSVLEVPASGIISDVNVVNLQGTHSWIHDLIVQLTSPQQTTVTLWMDICAGQDNFNLSFDDAAPAGPLPCPPTGGGTYRPLQPLSAFNGENAQGQWVLTIQDHSNPNGGTLEGWGLDICSEEVVGTLPPPAAPELSIYPNPSTGKFTLTTTPVVIPEGSLAEVVNAMGQSVQRFAWKPAGMQQLDLSGVPAGVYWVRVQGEKGMLVGKVIIGR